MGSIVDDARQGNIGAIREKLESGADIDFKNDQGDTALMWAVANQNIEMLNFLLDSGADPRVGNDKYRPLSLAEQYGYKEVIRILRNAEIKPREAKEEWRKMGASTVAHVGTYPAIHEKLTSVFNFSTRERYIISEGLDNDRKAIGATAGFDTLPQQAVEEALNQFEKLGGAVDRDFVLRGASSISKPKITAPHG